MKGGFCVELSHQILVPITNNQWPRHVAHKRSHHERQIQCGYLKKQNSSSLCESLLTLAFSKSKSFPMVDSSLQRHSRDSSSWFFSSFTTQSCMMASVSIFSLNSSPMNLMFPSERRRALSLASSSSTRRRSRSSWGQIQIGVKKWGNITGYI